MEDTLHALRRLTSPQAHRRRPLATGGQPGAGASLPELSNGGRRSMRSVRIPSTPPSGRPRPWRSRRSPVAPASRVLALRALPLIGGIHAARTASARARNRATISCGSNSGHGRQRRGVVAPGADRHRHRGDRAAPVAARLRPVPGVLLPTLTCGASAAPRPPARGTPLQWLDGRHGPYGSGRVRGGRHHGGPGWCDKEFS